MHVVAGKVITFSGILVKRYWKPGMKYVQLVFETSDGPRLALSRNIEMVKQLQMQGQYHIQGQTYNVDGKHYINEPRIAAVTKAVLHKPKKSGKSAGRLGALKKRTTLTVAMAVFVPVIGVSAAVYVFVPANTTNNETPANTSSSSSKQIIREEPQGNVLGASTQGTEEDQRALDESQLNPDGGVTPVSTPTPVPSPAPAPLPPPPTQEQAPISPPPGSTDSSAQVDSSTQQSSNLTTNEDTSQDPANPQTGA